MLEPVLPLEEPGPALHSPAGTRDTRRKKYKADKMSHGNSKASRAGEVDWKGGEEELPSGLAPASISSGLMTPSWAGALGSCNADARRKSPNGLPEEGLSEKGAGGQGLGSEPLGVRGREQLPLMVQEELGKGVDGINGLESDGSILGPQQVRAKDDSQVSVGHLVLVTLSRNLRREVRGLQQGHRPSSQALQPEQQGPALLPPSFRREADSPAPGRQ